MGYVDRLVRVERRAYALEDRLNETRKEMHRLNYELTLCRGAIADLQMVLNYTEALREARDGKKEEVKA